MTESSDERGRRLTFRREQRLGGRRAFAAVFDARLRKNAGPLAFVARPNGLERTRLGLSIGRRIGLSVTRQRLKRLLREAYRLQQHDLPRGYDVVIVVRPHATLSLDEYQRWLREGLAAIDREASKRRAKEVRHEREPLP